MIGCSKAPRKESPGGPSAAPSWRKEELQHFSTWHHIKTTFIHLLCVFPCFSTVSHGSGLLRRMPFRDLLFPWRKPQVYQRSSKQKPLWSHDPCFQEFFCFARAEIYNVRCFYPLWAWACSSVLLRTDGCVGSFQFLLNRRWKQTQETCSHQTIILIRIKRRMTKGGMWRNHGDVDVSHTREGGAPLAPPTVFDASKQTFSTCGPRPLCGPGRHWKWPLS